MLHGALFLQCLRPVNTEPDTFFAFAAGAIREAGLPVYRGQITLSHAQLLSYPRAMPDALATRLRALLERVRPAVIILNIALFDELVEWMQSVLPGVRVMLADEGIPLVPLRQMVEIVRSGRRLLTQPRFSEVLHEFYEAFYEGAIEPVFEVENLTPETQQEGIQGDLFLDSICYYRKPYQDNEHPALAGATACTFCTVPQVEVRPHSPRFSRFVEHLRAQQRAMPDARVLHVHDAAFSQHLDVFAASLESESFPPLEFCVSQRVPDILRHKASLERGLEMLSRQGHTVHFFLIGFESFAPAELSRFNKGYPTALNVDVVLYLRALKARFGKHLEYSRWKSHGFINYTPWTTRSDLRVVHGV